MRIEIANMDVILFSFFWTDIHAVKKYLAQNKEAVFSDDTDITPILDLQYAYNANPLKAIFYPIKNDCTIMFPNLQDGWLTLYKNIAKGLNSKSCYMMIMDDKKFAYPANFFRHYENGLERVVYTLKENKWVFYEQGEPLPFENTDYYVARIKRERLNKPIMSEYCEHLKIAKNGCIDFDVSEAFSYSLYWEGQHKDSTGFGATSLAIK